MLSFGHDPSVICYQKLSGLLLSPSTDPYQYQNCLYLYGSALHSDERIFYKVDLKFNLRELVSKYWFLLDHV